jgi:hypothetical protein
MTRSLLLVAVFASGCVVLPTTKTTLRNAGTETSALTPGRLTQVTLQSGASRTDVRVHATNTRECHREVYAVTEIVKSTHAKMNVDDPRLVALGLVAAPVTLPVSAIITGLIVASADDETSRTRRRLRTETVACTTDADGVALELQFPSGQIYRGRTDRHGVLALAIPAAEPYTGDVAVRGGDAAAQVHYEQKRPPVTAARDAIERCRAELHVEGVTVRITIDGRGGATRLSAASDTFDACVRRNISGVTFPATLRNTTIVLPFEAPTT